MDIGPGDEYPHYYVAGYSAENDPYCQENGVLVNILNLQNTKDLNEIEADFSALAIAELLSSPPQLPFDANTLKSIHKSIFKEVYPWAGEFRRVDIAKEKTAFGRHQDIQSGLDALFRSARHQAFFQGLNQQDLARELAIFLASLNFIHPFREGNGRTQRTILSIMAANAGYKIAWEGISSSAMRDACVASIEGSHARMQRLMGVYLVVDESGH